MQEQLILFIFGLVLFALGILFLKRDKKLFEDSPVVTAKLTGYYEYRATNNNATMYTMEVDYRIHDGTIIHAKEQGGSNRQKYAVGAEFEVCYSIEKPELFIRCGDNSRKYALYGMTAVGLILMALFGYMLLSGMF